MTLVLAIVILPVLLAVSSFAPGFYCVRRLGWNPMEKLCGAVGLSLVLIYLASGIIYVFEPADGLIHPLPYWAVAAACGVMAVAARKDIARLWSVRAVRRAVFGYALLLAWTLVMTAGIRNFSGAAWSSDWLEHFQRSLYFLYRYPVRTEILGHYLVPARPPMMNVLASYFLALTGDRFENFQVVFAFLNLLPFLACCQLLPRLAGRRGRILPLLALFALNPVMMESATYTWTKACAAFYVLLAIHFYLAGWKKQDSLRMTAAFLALSAGILVHYSAGPYVVFLALHYTIAVFWRRRAKWREAVMIGAVCGLLLATWFGWSIKTFGTHDTFASNTSITSSRQYEGHNVEKIWGNIVDTIIPPEIRDPGLMNAFPQPNGLGTLRDQFFISYQTNLLLMMGLCGGVVAVWLYWLGLRSPRLPRAERWFWAAMIPFCIVLGIASTGERDHFGLGHLTLLPVVFLGLTVVAGAMFSRRILTAVVLCGCVVDFAGGVWLQAYIEGMDNTPTRTVFRGLEFHGPGVSIGGAAPASLSQSSWNGWLQKHQFELTSQWLGALEERGRQNAVFAAQARNVIAMLSGLKEEDRLLWHGWYSRHSGGVTFLGDHLGEPGTGAMDVLLVAGMLILMFGIVQQWRSTGVKADSHAVRPGQFVPAPASRERLPRRNRTKRRAATGRGH